MFVPENELRLGSLDTPCRISKNSLDSSDASLNIIWTVRHGKAVVIKDQLAFEQVKPAYKIARAHTSKIAVSQNQAIDIGNVDVILGITC